MQTFYRRRDVFLVGRTEIYLPQSTDRWGRHLRLRTLPKTTVTSIITVIPVRETTYLSRFLHNDRRDGEAPLTPWSSRTVTHKPHIYRKCDEHDAHDDELQRFSKDGASTKAGGSRKSLK